MMRRGLSARLPARGTPWVQQTAQETDSRGKVRCGACCKKLERPVQKGVPARMHAPKGTAGRGRDISSEESERARERKKET